MSFVALAIEKLRANGNNIKLLIPHTITSQWYISTGLNTYINSLFINGKIPSKLALAFRKSAGALESWTNSPHKVEMFGLSSLVYKINGIPH